MDFQYLLRKIEDSPLQESPFQHLQINEWMSPEDFSAVVNSPEIKIPEVENDRELIAELLHAGYRVIDFPGCVNSVKEYLRWHKKKRLDHRIESCTEGFGMVLRLREPVSPPLLELKEFLNSPEFIASIAQKFGIDVEQCTYDGGIQKYLDGYEISPHPDIRSKALTFMVNINPGEGSSDAEIHTHYMKFKKEWQYVREYWEGRPTADRSWVPWDWCETVKQQRQNNSIVIFSPSNDTMHGVKTNYNHLKFQRTQLYGNLWYRSVEIDSRPKWQDFLLTDKRRFRFDELHEIVRQKSIRLMRKSRFLLGLEKRDEQTYYRREY